jgi:hypothetical protein
MEKKTKYGVERDKNEKEITKDGKDIAANLLLRENAAIEKEKNIGNKTIKDVERDENKQEITKEIRQA